MGRNMTLFRFKGKQKYYDHQIESRRWPKNRRNTPKEMKDVKATDDGIRKSSVAANDILQQINKYMYLKKLKKKGTQDGGDENRKINAEI